MDTQPPFDATTRCFDRVYGDIWKPYFFPEHRAERDMIFGPTPNDMLRRGPESFIPRKTFNEAYKATCFANYNAVTLSSMVTINWELAGWNDPEAINKEYADFATRMRKFSTYYGYEARYITVFENSVVNGIHSHTIFAVPHQLRERIKRWCHGAILVPDPYAVNPKDCYQLDLESDGNIVAQWNLFRYVMKTLDPALSTAEKKVYGDTAKATDLLDLKKWEHKFSEAVPFRRVHISQSLTTKARHDAGFRPLHDIRATSLPARERYSDAELKRGKERAAHVAALAWLARNPFQPLR